MFVSERRPHVKFLNWQDSFIISFKQLGVFIPLTPKETKETTVLLIFRGKLAIWVKTNTKSSLFLCVIWKIELWFLYTKCTWWIKETKKWKKNFFKSQIYCFMFTKIQYVIMSYFHESPENTFHHLLPHTDALDTSNRKIFSGCYNCPSCTV